MMEYQKIRKTGRFCGEPLRFEQTLDFSIHTKKNIGHCTLDDGGGKILHFQTMRLAELPWKI